MKFFYILFLTLLSSYTYSQDVDPSHCPCKGNENKEKQLYSTEYYPYLPNDDSEFVLNPYAAERIMDIIYDFLQIDKIDIDYSFSIRGLLNDEWYFYEKSFVEARNYLIPFLEKNLEKGIVYSTALTFSENSKYLIPYCFGVDKLFIYKFNYLFPASLGTYEPPSFWKDSPVALYKEINIKEEIEAVKFFEKYLIVITKGKIIAFYSNGPKKMW